ncbi:MAG: histidine kinase dimerization/phosphoacceptor domain -containing protein [Flavobacteriales bacterium]
MHKPLLAFNLGMHGIINDIKGNRSKALFYYQRSLELKIQLKDSAGIASTYTNIGALFYSQGMYGKSLAYFNRSLDIEQRTSNYEGMVGSYIDIAVIYKNLNRKDSAIYFLNKAEGINQINRNPHQDAYINANLGSLYFESKSLDTARYYFDKAIRVNREIDNRRALAISLDNRAKIAMYQNELGKAKLLLVEAGEIARRGRFIDAQLKIFEGFYEYELIYGNIQNALDYKDSMSAIRDSIYNEKLNNQINELETKYEVAKSRAQLLEQESILIRNKSKFQMLYFGIIFLTLVIAILLFLYLYIRRSNRIIKSKNEIIEKAFRERELLIREIHHRVKNNIQSIKSLLGLHQRRTNDENIRQVIQDIVNRLHSMTFVHENLYQQKEMLDISIDEYLREIIISVVKSFGHPQTEEYIKIEINPQQLAIDKLLTLGLITNEIVSNACKYGLKDEVLELSVEGEFQIQGNFYRLRFKDKGPGVLNGDLRNFGMELIELMTNKLGGEIVYENTTQGLLITLSFPVS